jgi:hypothetical protein
MDPSFGNKFKLKPLPQHDFPSHKCFFHKLVLGRVGGKTGTIHFLAPFSLTPTSFDTTSIYINLHLESYGFFPFFLKDYKPN